ncbi:capreomycidine synthase [Saccharomonospora azurea]|uniref:capreomycidine synthase n=1 Tax=Saccharomonospora azurea TaxID=40988 RepID=UPI00024000C0|nr:capreomycidine synthase [Saccharomonospora azurea]EHK89314.1 class I and II aminotransferase [Saccharomonospora azurea SZMC 14600]
MGIADITPSLLEDWLRSRYFNAKVDISSSGVQNYSLGEVRDLLELSTSDLDAVVFRDSPSLGCDALREAVATVSGRSFEEVVITHGSSEALFLALAAVIRPSDEVVVLQPVYQSLSSIAEALGARLRVWELDSRQGFRPDLDRLRGLLTPATRAVLVNFPHNPTGACLSTEEYTEFLSILADHPCYLVWDNAFGALAYDVSLPDPGITRPRVITTGTMSKAYGLPGLRVGWAITPPDLHPTMAKIRDYVSISTSPLAELIATEALRRADRLVTPRLRQAAHNRDLLCSWAAKNADHVSLPLPVGGVSAFPAILGVDEVTPLCDRLNDEGVLVVPGTCFGYPNRIRIGFGGPTDELQTGLAMLTRVLHEWSTAELGR